MKRRILLITLILAMLLSALAFANVASAECTVSKHTNISKQASITYTSDATYVRAEKLVDGNNLTGTWTGGGSFTFTFAESRNISHVALAINCMMTGSDYAYPTATTWNCQANDRSVGKVKVEYFNEAGEVIWAGELETKTTGGPVTVKSPDAYMVKKVTVHVWEAWSQWGKTPLGEVMIYEQEGAHDWSLTSTTTAPKCEETGVGTYECACGETKTDIIPATGHIASVEIYDDATSGTHYNLCTVAGCGARCYESPHTYDDDCEDDDCNLCYAIRTAPGHIYTAECDTECDVCSSGTRVASEPHVFDADCDLDCNNCGSENPRYITCQYDNACDATCNNPGCTFPPREVPNHVFLSVCDAYCRECGIDNPELVDHKFTAECDVDCNWAGCTYVKAEEDVKPHVYTNNCDPTCNKCNFNRGEREHNWENACDDICDTCGETRNTSHTWENDCDDLCNICQYTRTIAGHSYSDIIPVVPPTATEVGYNKKICTICGIEDLIEVPATGEVEKTGIPGWAIALIIVGSVLVVAACAVVAVYVLVLKPKMEAKKKAELEAQKNAENDDEDDDDDEDEDDEEDDEDEDEESDEDESEEEEE